MVYLLKMVIFHGYVKLPEGTYNLPGWMMLGFSMVFPFFQTKTHEGLVSRCCIYKYIFAYFDISWIIMKYAYLFYFILLYYELFIYIYIYIYMYLGCFGIVWYILMYFDICWFIMTYHIMIYHGILCIIYSSILCYSMPWYTMIFRE